ncbi:nitrate transporter [Ascobolus immersus RN42]|uniref:Nitrate/nitrite transporter n=1 Tax=Ascobolus immersus RN42 TaxID=1160509 RepID=A0A3N4HFN0_ASCIM|nr:nitrate transporter [Ascobolus immersus RN42]
MKLSTLWTAPRINPLNRKAHSVPVFNPVNQYGRTFFFSTFGFMIAFMSWYAFPPLLSKTIKADLHLTQADIANSNIAALSATLIVRFLIGPLCDRFGPRYCYIGVLLAGAIPTALAGTINSAAGLIAIRFFVGILGGTFVPCQVWSTGFFDKDVVGTANALMAGLGNAGGGITYFVMPAIFDSLVEKQGLTPHVAWRVAFVVPFILITATALGMLFLCEDTPTGSWSDRHNAVHNNVLQREKSHQSARIVDAPTGDLTTAPTPSSDSSSGISQKKKAPGPNTSAASLESASDNDATLALETEAEVIVAPTTREILRLFASPQTLMLAAPYVCSFGGELAINSILGSYYMRNFKQLDQTSSGMWASMFGLLNLFFRPLGGIVADILYKKTSHNVHVKKYWISFLGVMMGGFCLLIGLLNPHDLPTMIGLVAGLALFMDASNGANFALVPHVHPFANGVLSGIVGASGNLGGVIFALLFRFVAHEGQYHTVIWIIGVVSIAINVGITFIRTLPKGQIGGH